MYVCVSGSPAIYDSLMWGRHNVRRSWGLGGRVGGRALSAHLPEPGYDGDSVWRDQEQGVCLDEKGC